MKTLASSLVVLSLFTGSTTARTVFDDIRDSAPRSVFDQIRDTAPKSIFDQIRHSAPRSGEVQGEPIGENR